MATAFFAACSQSAAPTSSQSANSANPNTGTNVKPPTAVDGKTAPPLASGHDSTAAKPADNAQTAAPAPSDEETAAVPKPLQEKVAKAEAKAKAAGATPADKTAAAAVFVERGNIFYEAGKPSFYKYALRDFRIAARFDPSNAEAADKRDQILQIYQSLGKPAPTLGEQP